MVLSYHTFWKKNRDDWLFFCFWSDFFIEKKVVPDGIAFFEFYSSMTLRSSADL